MDPRDPVVLLRDGVSIVLAALVSVIGALVLGEYEFTGTLPFVAGVLFGFVIGELVVTLARHRSWPLAVAAALCSAGGIVGAGWIDADRGVEPFRSVVWVAAALAAAATLLRVAGKPTRQD